MGGSLCFDALRQILIRRRAACRPGAAASYESAVEPGAQSCCLCQQPAAQVEFYVAGHRLHRASALAMFVVLLECLSRI